MALSSTPHDLLFRALVSRSHCTVALLQMHLPVEMTALINFVHPPEPEEGKFADGKSAKTQCDALFRVRLKGGQDARVFMFLEHKSRVDPSALLQVAQYLLNIWTGTEDDTGIQQASNDLAYCILSWSRRLDASLITDGDDRRTQRCW